MAAYRQDFIGGLHCAVRSAGSSIDDIGALWGTEGLRDPGIANSRFVSVSQGDASSRTSAFIPLAQGDHGRNADDGEIAASACFFHEARAAARFRRGQLDLHRHFIGSKVGGQRANEKVRACLGPMVLLAHLISSRAQTLSAPFAAAFASICLWRCKCRKH
jgi:hypothetical protein